MSGTYRRLGPGRYQLLVESGHGPAGVRRARGENVSIGVEGGSRDFSVWENEEVYYWWRGPVRRRGVRLVDESFQRPGRRMAAMT